MPEDKKLEKPKKAVRFNITSITSLEKELAQWIKKNKIDTEKLITTLYENKIANEFTELLNIDDITNLQEKLAQWIKQNKIDTEKLITTLYENKIAEEFAELLNNDDITNLQEKLVQRIKQDEIGTAELLNILYENKIDEFTKLLNIDDITIFKPIFDLLKPNLRNCIHEHLNNIKPNRKDEEKLIRINSMRLYFSLTRNIEKSQDMHQYIYEAIKPFRPFGIKTQTEFTFIKTKLLTNGHHKEYSTAKVFIALLAFIQGQNPLEHLIDDSSDKLLNDDNKTSDKSWLKQEVGYLNVAFLVARDILPKWNTKFQKAKYKAIANILTLAGLSSDKIDELSLQDKSQLHSQSTSTEIEYEKKLKDIFQTSIDAIEDKTTALPITDKLRPILHSYPAFISAQRNSSGLKGARSEKIVWGLFHQLTNKPSSSNTSGHSNMNH